MFVEKMDKKMLRLNLYKKLQEMSETIEKLPTSEANTLDFAQTVLKDDEVQKIIEHTFDRNQRIRNVRKQLKHTT
jgi:hypothetical protein